MEPLLTAGAALIVGTAACGLYQLLNYPHLIF
mgnify:CR=1 FL=1